jgi:murein DD-endopeptidase MepM/ murein hydrolase activator NlpD
MKDQERSTAFYHGIPWLARAACLTLVVLGLLLWLPLPAAAQDPTPIDIDPQEPTPAVTPEPTPEAPVYVVQPGDTLYSIAQRFGTTVESIVAANDIADPSLISVGQRLLIPTEQPELVPSTEPRPNTRVHPVRAGETLPLLAFRYGTTVWALREANDLDRLGLLWPGQDLDIPPPTAATAATPDYPAISASPAPVAQGRTMAVQVEGRAAMDLSGSFLGQDLVFVGEEGHYWALVGVDALAPPGAYRLPLKAIEADTGDRLTMQGTFTVTEGTFTTYNVVVPPDRQGLLDPTVSQAERVKVNAVFAIVSEERLWEGAFGVPLAGELRTTAPFGQRRSYNSGPVASYHTGHDYGADAGTPVYAPMTATVALAEPLQVRGKVVILDHGLGVFTGFWHLSRIDVTEGQVVSQGEVVGLVGNTGLSTGPHLHWEMRVLGVPVDPLQWTRREFP